ncbi:MAG: DUF5810 domain-containing protein [Haloarculaceae archaeon]
MGYACPVCEEPQADGTHLANHLAFTALMGDDDHESWLDDHEPGWGELGESELAEIVVDHAEEVPFPFDESASGHPHDHDGHAPPDVGTSARNRSRGDRPLDDEARSIIDEARAMTREMERDGDSDGDDDTGEPPRDESE